MKPVEFPEQTIVLTRPESMTEEECSSLPVFRDGVHCISCWQLSDDEIVELIKNDGKIFLGIFSGMTQPPVFLTVQSPFVKQ